MAWPKGRPLRDEMRQKQSATSKARFAQKRELIAEALAAHAAAVRAKAEAEADAARKRELIAEALAAHAAAVKAKAEVDVARAEREAERAAQAAAADRGAHAHSQEPGR